MAFDKWRHRNLTYLPISLVKTYFYYPLTHLSLVTSFMSDLVAVVITFLFSKVSLNEGLLKLIISLKKIPQPFFNTKPDFCFFIYCLSTNCNTLSCIVIIRELLPYQEVLSTNWLFLSEFLSAHFNKQQAFIH